MGKVEVIIRGSKVMVAEHLLADLARFGVTREARNVKPIPKELLKMPLTKTVIPVADLLPKMENTKPEEVITPVIETLEKTPSKRKSPVRSKSKK